MLFFTFYKVHKHVDQKIALECSSSALEENIMMNSDLPVKTSLVSVSTQTEALNWHYSFDCTFKICHFLRFIVILQILQVA